MKNQTFAAAKLPNYLRVEWDGHLANVAFRCECSPEEGQSYMARVEEKGSSMHFRCRNCRRLFQLRASAEVVIEEPAAGNGN